MSFPQDAATVAGLVYLSVYLTIGVLGVRQELAEPTWPRGLFFATLPAFPLSAAGAFFWLSGVQPGQWGVPWWPVFAYALVADLIELPFAVRRLREEAAQDPDGEVEPGERSAVPVVAALLAFAVFELPCLWMNARLALQGLGLA